VTIISHFPPGRVGLPNSPIWPLLFANQSFNNAVSSVGYAGLSNVTKNPQHMVVARKKYAISLRNITSALMDTSKADLDATFKSVMLLAAFEVSLIPVSGSYANIYRLSMEVRLVLVLDHGAYISTAEQPS